MRQLHGDKTSGGKTSVKLYQSEIKVQETFVFVSKFWTVTHLDFLHARNMQHSVCQ